MTTFIILVLVAALPIVSVIIVDRFRQAKAKKEAAETSAKSVPTLPPRISDQELNRLAQKHRDAVKVGLGMPYHKVNQLQPTYKQKAEFKPREIKRPRNKLVEQDDEIYQTVGSVYTIEEPPVIIIQRTPIIYEPTIEPVRDGKFGGAGASGSWDQQETVSQPDDSLKCVNETVTYSTPEPTPVVEDRSSYESSGYSSTVDSSSNDSNASSSSSDNYSVDSN